MVHGPSPLHLEGELSISHSGQGHVNFNQWWRGKMGFEVLKTSNLFIYPTMATGFCMAYLLHMFTIVALAASDDLRYVHTNTHSLVTLLHLVLSVATITFNCPNLAKKSTDRALTDRSSKKFWLNRIYIYGWGRKTYKCLSTRCTF